MSYTQSEMARQPSRPLQVRIVKSFWYPNYYKIQYKRSWLSPWRDIKVYPCQYVMPQKMGHTYLYCTLMLSDETIAKQIASGFHEASDLDTHFQYQKHLHEQVYQKLDRNSLYLAGHYTHAGIPKMVSREGVV